MTTSVSISTKNPSLLGPYLTTYYGSGVTILKSVSAIDGTGEIIFLCPQICPDAIRIFNNAGTLATVLRATLVTWNPETSTYTTITEFGGSLYYNTAGLSYAGISGFISDTFIMLHTPCSDDLNRKTLLFSQTNEIIPRFFVGGFSNHSLIDNGVNHKSFLITNVGYVSGVKVDVKLLGLTTDWGSSTGKIFTGPLLISVALEGLVYNDNVPITLKNMMSCSKVVTNTPISGSTHCLLPNNLYGVDGKIGANILIDIT